MGYKLTEKAKTEGWRTPDDDDDYFLPKTIGGEYFEVIILYKYSGIPQKEVDTVWVDYTSDEWYFDHFEFDSPDYKILAYRPLSTDVDELIFEDKEE